MDPALSWTIKLALAMLFAASSAMKFADLSRFAAAVANYRVLPRVLSKPAALMVPALETAGAADLLFSSTRTAAAIVVAALLTVFTAAIAINLLRGRRDIDCGCFGAALRQTLSGALLARNLVLLAAVAALAAPVRPRPLGASDFVTIVLGAATLNLLYASTNYLLANLPWVRELERLHA